MTTEGFPSACEFMNRLTSLSQDTSRSFVETCKAAGQADRQADRQTDRRQSSGGERPIFIIILLATGGAAFLSLNIGTGEPSHCFVFPLV
jgi:hypothetical protein